MKYKNEVIINLPLQEVLDKFDNQENMYKWMEGLVGHEQIEGVPGEVGSVMKMNFKLGKSEFEMVERITLKELPERYAGSYETKFATNQISNSFEAISDHATKLKSETELIPHSFVVKLMTWFLPGTFKSQSQKYLENFKNFAEGKNL